jgi:hypothetical protein
MTTKFSYQTLFASWKGERKMVTENVILSELKKLVRAIKSSDFSHVRTRGWCGFDMTSIYHRDRTSPTGVLLNAGGHYELVKAFLLRFRPSAVQ